MLTIQELSDFNIYLNKSNTVPQLTNVQLEAIIEAIKGNELICEICGVGWFGKIGLRVWTPPIYPGCPMEKVLLLSQQHLPESNYPQSHKATLGTPPDDAWELFTSLVLTEKNVKSLEWCGLRIPKDKLEYAY